MGAILADARRLVQSGRRRRMRAGGPWQRRGRSRRRYSGIATFTWKKRDTAFVGPALSRPAATARLRTRRYLAVTEHDFPTMNLVKTDF